MTWTKEAIRDLRLRLGLTQSEFAFKLGCRQQTVSEWELGIYAPGNAYGRLLEVFGHDQRTPVIADGTSPLSETLKNLVTNARAQIDSFDIKS